MFQERVEGGRGREEGKNEKKKKEKFSKWKT